MTLGAPDSDRISWIQATYAGARVPSPCCLGSAESSAGSLALQSPGGGGRPGALRLVTRYSGPIHLLLTDVVMPQVDDAIVRHGVSESGTSFLRKPFTPDMLARMLPPVPRSRIWRYVVRLPAAPDRKESSTN